MTRPNVKTTDYNSVPIPAEELADLKAIADVSLSDLKLDKDAPLLVFPDNLHSYDPDFGRKVICEITDGDKILKTNSMVGFVGRNRTRLSIHSRFSDGEQDCFLHYMIRKIVGVNIMNLSHTSDDDSVFDFLVYLFPVFLKRAFRQGVFKKYGTKRYNDSNVRGVIDISRHIRSNIPFNGRIAYSKREYSYDNHITQLIRHTIEFIRKTKRYADLVDQDCETRKSVNIIINVTPSYVPQDRNIIINKNISQIVHPFFSEYTHLQRLCLQILRGEEIKYGNKPDEIYGIIMDAAWLWEEYLATVISSKFNHYKKNQGKRFYLFENFQQIIPDYLSFDRRTVADAKYIRLNNQRSYQEEKATAIYYKTITYMYRFCSDVGYLLYPQSDSDPQEEHYKIKTEQDGVNGGSIIKLGLRIPHPAQYKDFSEFSSLMKSYEEEFMAKLKV